MKILFGILVLVTIVINFNGASAQSAGPKKKAKDQPNLLIGTWQLIDFANADSLGNWEYPFGKHPRGFVTYTRTRIFNINMSSEIPLAVTEAEAKSRTITLDDFLWKYSFGYFGTYSVNFKNSVVTHEVKGGTIPWFVGTGQPRPFILKGDTLIIGDNKTWKRVLVKAD
jgi:hypothetical protein